MFVDEVQVTLTAGRGGDGIVSWRREKYIPKGGPWGGNGGNGGDIILYADPNHNTLSDFRYKKVFLGQDGQNGGMNNMNGANAPDLTLSVPVGTLVKNTNGELLHDLSTPHESLRICRGGRGGYGNSHFTSSTRQKPNFAERGDRGETIEVILELKLVADIGIIGLPSAGKSTLISCLTNARPKVADYPFTTLVPHLGIMEHKGLSLVLEDVPGLIPGAHKGEGLGIQFLKHIQRSKSLLHMLDASHAEQCLENYRAIRAELELFDPELSEKREIIVLSKTDLISEHDLETLKEMITHEFPDKDIFAISGPIGVGMSELKDFLIDNFASDTDEDKRQIDTKHIIDLREEVDPNAYTIEEIEDYTYRLYGKRIQQIVRMSEPSNSEATSRIYDVLQKRNVLREIEKLANKTFEKNNPHTSLSPGEIWYHIGDEAKLLIEDRSFPLNRILYMNEY